MLPYSLKGGTVIWPLLLSSLAARGILALAAACGPALGAYLKGHLEADREAVMGVIVSLVNEKRLAGPGLPLNGKKGRRRFQTMKLCLFSNRLTVLLMVLMFPWQVLAHGVEGTVQPGGLAVLCQYDTGEPMSYAKVTVLSPAALQPFQVGHTDKNGRFCFYPDALGEWRVTADDGMGHRLEVKATVKDLEAMQKNLPAAGAGAVSATKLPRVLTGLSAIFALAGFLFWFKGIRLKQGHKEPPS